jgi:predicted RNase H-like nuclease (RuvC/YqgF family)
MQAFDDLEAMVARAARQLKELRGELREARAEGTETKELLRQFTDGEKDPASMLTRLEKLEAENKDLLFRVNKGKEGVERLLARIRFLEEQG